jgi:capsular polysaccharide transport system permease protein
VRRVQQFNPRSEQPAGVDQLSLPVPGNRVPGSHPARGWLAPSQGFIVIVVLPTLLSVIYYGLLAANRYVSQSQFVIRNPMAAMSGQLSSLLSSVPGGHGSQEAFVVHAYIKSRDAVRDIAAETGLREALGYPRLDMLWRYPGPFFDHSEERLFRQFQSLVTVRLDNSTGINTLSVQAFRPADAERIVTALLKHAEILVNRLGERSQSDNLRAAENDVELTRNASRDAHQALTGFRIRHAIADPNRLFQVAQDTLLELAKSTALTSVLLRDLQTSSPQSPQIATFKLRIQALDEQSLAERQRFAGADGTLSKLIVEFERLSLEREFAERALTSAVAGLETTRVRTQRQRMFLEQISKPSVPDRYTHPSRLLGVFLVMLISFLIYIVSSTLRVELRSHAGR